MRAAQQQRERFACARPPTRGTRARHGLRRTAWRWRRLLAPDVLSPLAARPAGTGTLLSLLRREPGDVDKQDYSWARSNGSSFYYWGCYALVTAAELQCCTQPLQL